MMASSKRLSTSKQEVSKKLRNSGSEVASTGSAMFTGIRAFVLPAGIGNARLNIFKNQIRKHGGEIIDDFDMTKVNRAVVDDSVSPEKAKVLLSGGGLVTNLTGTSADRGSGVNCVCVKASWLSQCLKSNQLIDTGNYQLKGVLEDEKQYENHNRIVDPDPSLTATPSTSCANELTPKCDDKPVVNNKRSYTVNNSKFICASSSSTKQQNFNEHITEKLQVLAETYKNTKDQWRALGYERAISVLKNHGKRISSREEAQGLSGIGERLADKIWEIVESGRLRKMEEVCSEDWVKALNLFTNIWGVGPTTAQQFVQQGFRTLDDLRERGNLNRQQKIGLQHYDDILDRMPREEATQIQQTVREAALSVMPDLEVVACGSYRRGKANCGDVDVLVTHPDGRSHVGLLPRILQLLHQSGFLTDDLVAHEENGGQHKYLGVCKLPGPNSKHRRLDIIVIPYAEFACSLLYFTGSAHFNRSMRLLARKMGMALSEHSLRDGVVRRGTEKISEGRVLPTPTEESVFQHLGLTYRSPAERDH